MILTFILFADGISCFLSWTCLACIAFQTMLVWGQFHVRIAMKEKKQSCYLKWAISVGDCNDGCYWGAKMNSVNKCMRKSLRCSKSSLRNMSIFLFLLLVRWLNNWRNLKGLQGIRGKGTNLDPTKSLIRRYQHQQLITAWEMDYFGKSLSSTTVKSCGNS